VKIATGLFDPDALAERKGQDKENDFKEGGWS